MREREKREAEEALAREVQEEEAKAVFAQKYAHAYPGKKKGWAVAWWFLGYFGFFGLHSFYLGKKKAGLLKLAAFLILVIALRKIGRGRGDFLMILPSFGRLALFIWNFVDLVKIIRLPKVAFEPAPSNSAPHPPA